MYFEYIILLFVIIGISAIYYKKYIKNVILRDSKKIQKLLVLNEDFSNNKFKEFLPKGDRFSIIINEGFKYKQTYDDLNGEKVLKKVIQVFIDNIEEFGKKIGDAEENKLLWDAYNTDFSKIIRLSTQFTKRRFKKTENKLLRNLKLEKPCMDGILKFNAKYTSRKGNSRHEWTWTYNFHEIKLTYQDALKEINYRESKEHFKKLQRSKISDSTRFDIFKRDNYKCKICGQSPESNPNITLHLDHIVPVALGGTSEYDNLQTLCSECNLGKKAKLM